MDIAIASLARQRLHVNAALVVIMPVEDYLSSHGLHRLDLARIRPDRHADHRRNIEAAGRVGNRLAMVPRRGGNHTVCPLLIAELRHKVQPAADLEGANGLVVLVLDVNGKTDERVQRRIISKQRWLKKAP